MKVENHDGVQSTSYISVFLSCQCTILLFCSNNMSAALGAGAFKVDWSIPLGAVSTKADSTGKDTFCFMQIHAYEK